MKTAPHATEAAMTDIPKQLKDAANAMVAEAYPEPVQSVMAQAVICVKDVKGMQTLQKNAADAMVTG